MPKMYNVDGADLPDSCCDDMEIDCPHCFHEFLIGWYATLEIR